MNLQDNVKIILIGTENKLATYNIVDKKTNNIVVSRSVRTNETNEEEIAKDCQDDYCEWYRKGGRNKLRDYYTV